MSAPQWEPPVPLGSSRALPKFPTEVLPGWLRSFIEAEAEATQTPVDLAAMFALGSLATVAGGRVFVEAAPGWREGTNVFIAVAMEPGSRKSAVQRDMCAPIRAIEQELCEQLAPVIAEASSRRRIAKAVLGNAEAAAAQAKPEARAQLQGVAATAALELEAVANPGSARLFTADATPEALVTLLFENHGRMAVLSAEGGIFDLMVGRYSKGVPNLDVFLSGHAGDAIRVDRRGRPPEFIDEPALTIAVAVQPFVLRKAAHPSDMRGRGLLDRFLYAIPAGNIGYRQVTTTPVAAGLRADYIAAVAELGFALNALPEPLTLSLTEDASTALTRWREELEPRRRPDAGLGHVQGWASKLDGATVRLAGLIHLATNAHGDVATAIELEGMAAAVTIARYLIEHALAAFASMGADPRVADAERILRWAAIGQLASFSRRDAHYAHKAHFARAADIDPALALLVEHGYVVRISDEPRPGRPSIRYCVNPVLWGQNGRNPTQPSDSSVGSVGSVATFPRSGLPASVPLQ